MRRRIPEFFNFMKVEEQIEWNERLWCANAWGSKYDRNSGAYRYICDFYGIPFLPYGPGSDFEFVCKNALSLIDQDLINQKGFAFDYMLIDEGQDFKESFITLCETVTESAVYVAGDIFQSIFDTNEMARVQSDFLLSKCYRTDPRTLMFAHGVGMGLFETQKLRWLKKEEWEACGYIVEKPEKEIYEFSREPLRRFEDIKSYNIDSVEICRSGDNFIQGTVEEIIRLVGTIRDENPTVLAEDIGIIFVDSDSDIYTISDILSVEIPKVHGWEVNKAHESKKKMSEMLFVSNKNNVKGLEFPFVVCVCKKLSNSRSFRNSIYTMVTRSFIKTYFVLGDLCGEDNIGNISQSLDYINKNSSMRVSISKEEEDRLIQSVINYDDESFSLYDYVYELFEEFEIPAIFRSEIFDRVKVLYADDDLDKTMVREGVEFLLRQRNLLK